VANSQRIATHQIASTLNYKNQKSKKEVVLHLPSDDERVCAVSRQGRAVAVEQNDLVEAAKVLVIWAEDAAGPAVSSVGLKDKASERSK
jgi:peroxiredoxin